MTPERARELFSDAFEGVLSSPERAAFDELLSSDPVLQSEYEGFVEVLRLARRSSRIDTPNLLPGVQRRLRRGSRGRYYRDRFAQKVGSGALNPWLLAGAMIAIILLAWLGLSVLHEVRLP